MTAQPLAGRTVLVLRSMAQAAALADRVRALGGEPLVAPTVAVEPGDLDALTAAVRRLAVGGYRLVVVTSPNGVDALAFALADAGLPVTALEQTEVVAVTGRGTRTAFEDRLERAVDVLPGAATSAAIGAAVPPGPGRALLARADLASDELPALLRGRGYEVDDVVAYRVTAPAGLPPAAEQALAADRVDLIAATSPSTVRNLLALRDGRLPRAAVVSIGPVTSAACRRLGLEVAAEADPHDLDGLVAALVAAAG